MPSSTPIRALCAAASLAGLSACSGGSSGQQFAPVCPTSGILRDGADVTRFRGAGTDLTDMVIDGRITGLGGKCQLDDSKHLRTQLNVRLDLTRGPAARGATQDVAYFVSVSQGDRILDKQIYRLNASFPGNADRARITTDEVDLVLPINDTMQGNSYSILVGFQLTPEELAFNRRRGPR
jgi:hypothetical protein